MFVLTDYIPRPRRTAIQTICAHEEHSCGPLPKTARNEIPAKLTAEPRGATDEFEQSLHIATPPDRRPSPADP
ncbi:unnamed protein product, partial [Iphiclides podalirius]